MKTAVLGATGYTGQVLLRILSEHPDVEQIMAASSSQAGTKVRAADPGLPPGIEAKIPGGLLVTPQDVLGAAAQKGRIDVVFSALPHLKSAEICAPLFGKTVVIDLSADFRLHDPAVFLKAYGVPVRDRISCPAPRTVFRSGIQLQSGKQTSSPILAATPRPRSSPFSRSHGRDF